MIIYTKADDEYAMQAFKVNSLDYLLKPIESDELETAFQKFNEYNKSVIKEQNTNIDFTELASLIKSQKTEYRKRILIQSNESFFHLSVEKIAFFYSISGVTLAVTFEKREDPINFSLEILKEQLNPDSFFKVNRHIIINIESIQKVHSYFNNKLLIETTPSHKEEIIIGKDKTASFKR